MNPIETLRRGIELFNAGDFAAGAQLLSEDIRWYPRSTAAWGGEPLVGRAAIARLFTEQAEALGGPGNYRIEILRIDDLGGGTLLLDQRMIGRGSASGVEVTDHFITVWTFRRGACVRVDAYEDYAAAAADLGLG